MKTPLLPCLGSLLLASAALAEHRDDRDYRDGRRDRPRVIIYQHDGFRGDLLVLYPGDVIENMSGRTFENGAKLNDSITSIRIEGGAEVFAYENARFRGEALRLTESARDLTGRPVAGGVSLNWNDRISSLKIERTRGGREWDRDDRGPGRPGNDRPGNDRPGNDRPGYERPRDPDKVVKDTFKDLLGRDPDPGELREFRGRIVDAGWTERMLRDHLRNEDRYRVEAADLIVRRAYREVLGREADESGLRTYRRNVLDRGWTESDVRDDLRKSPEYRNRPRN